MIPLTWSLEDLSAQLAKLEQEKPVLACHPSEEAYVRILLWTYGADHAVRLHPTPFCPRGTYYLMKGTPLTYADPRTGGAL